MERIDNYHQKRLLFEKGVITKIEDMNEIEVKKPFKGKAFYNPSGKAREYSYWACNFYTGCSNDCDYCYLKKGYLKRTWTPYPKLKRCFKDEKHAIACFLLELLINKKSLQENGILFTFTSDPYLPETKDLFLEALIICWSHEVPVYTLSKCKIELILGPHSLPKFLYPGATLTGQDNLEPGAASNAERIKSIIENHNHLFKTWVSFEPVISFQDTLEMIHQVRDHCELFKIGLLSGAKYNKREVRIFIMRVLEMIKDKPIYFKDSLLKKAGMTREYLPKNCVGRNFKLHNEE